MKRTVTVILFTSIFFLPGSSQELIKMAEKYIADLASIEMEGRGYVNDGMTKAANYMSVAFNRAGLKPLGKSYFQTYTHAVNTFPDSMRVEIDDTRLIAGKDYIVFPGSGSSNASFTVTPLNEKTIWSFKAKKNTAAFFQVTHVIKDKDSAAMLENLLFTLAQHMPVIKVSTEKLTWGVSHGYDTTHCTYIILSSTSFTQVPKKIFLHVKAAFNSSFTGNNVCAMLPASKRSKKYVVFCAHYDHLGKMGSDAMFRGANDNAGGCAMLLCLAHELAKTKRDVNYVFIAFGSEEAGLIGSTWFTEHPLIKLKRIKFLLNLDLVGTGEDGITVVNATEFPEAFSKLEKINADNDYFTLVKKRGPAANSDHHPFYKKGVPSFFIYTMGGSKAYHDIYDLPENLKLEGFSPLVKMLLTFCTDLK